MLSCLLLVSCSEEPDKNKEGKSSDTAKPASIWKAPQFENLGITIKRHNGTENSHSFYPGSPLSEATSDPTSSLKVDSMGKSFEVTLSYLGNKDGCDQYKVLIVTTSEDKTQTNTKLADYNGRDLEVWRDDNWLIKLGPKK